MERARRLARNRLRLRLRSRGRLRLSVFLSMRHAYAQLIE